MYKVNIAKLRQALMFWRELPEEKFDFEAVVSSYDASGCGTICCLIGWTPEIFQDECHWSVNNDMNCSVNDKHFSEVAFDLFGIKPAIANNMFSPSGQELVHEYLDETDAVATPTTACDMIECFIGLVESNEIHNHVPLIPA